MMNLVKRTILMTVNTAAVCLLCSVPVHGLCGSVHLAEDTGLRFREKTISHGLSQNSITAIVQDKQGFMWFGTTDGLNRFDGREFLVFKHDDSNPNTISSNMINSLMIDRDGVLWAGTSGGINRIDPETYRITSFAQNTDFLYLCNHKVQAVCQDSFGALWIGTEGGLHRWDLESRSTTIFLPDSIDHNSVPHCDIMCLLPDNRNRMWIGTFGGGAAYYDLEEKAFHRFNHKSNDPASLSCSIVRSIYQDSDSIIWIGTEQGLNKHVEGTDSFVRYTSEKYSVSGMAYDWIEAMFEDPAGRFWIGTEGHGVLLFNRDTETFKPLASLTDLAYPMSDDRITEFHLDRTGTFWIGTWNGGLNITDFHAKKFANIQNNPADQNSLCNNVVYCIHKDSTGTLWVGTNQGISVFNIKNNNWKHYYAEPGTGTGLGSNAISAVNQDKEGMYWIGTRGGGLTRYNPETEKFYTYTHDPDNPNSLSYNTIWSMLVDSYGYVWIGTAGMGVDRLNTETGEFVHYKDLQPGEAGPAHNTVNFLYEDTDGNIWAGTAAGGASVWNRSANSFSKTEIEQIQPSAAFSIESITEFPDSVFWLGTQQGLLQYSRKNQSLRVYTEDDGLPNNTIYGILPDSHGRLWMSTNRGLSCMDPDSETFLNYDASDGLQSNEFNTGAYCRDSAGCLYFGGVKGITVFHPDSIAPDTTTPPVVLTDFKVFNKTVPVAEAFQGDTLLHKIISCTDKINLSYKHRFLSFSFAALHYACPEKNQYAYRLYPFEEEWNYSGNRNYVMYSNLPHGEYTFMVKGANSDGVWAGKGVSLSVHVRPPFWQAWWFRIVFILFSAGVIITVHLLHTSSIRTRNRELEQRVKERTSELAQTNEQLNTSLKEKELLLREVHHRVKNNFQVISSLLSLQNSSVKDKYAKTVLTDSRNRVNTMALIHERLYKAENLASINLSEYISSLARTLYQTYDVSSERVGLQMDIDDVPIGIDQAIPCGLIINELISNSLKYAFTKGESKCLISVSLRKTDGGYLELSVFDNGSGMPCDFSIEKSDSLGLTLVKILAEDQLQGSVTINNDSGTVFLIRFPMSTD